MYGLNFFKVSRMLINIYALMELINIQIIKFCFSKGILSLFIRDNLSLDATTGIHIKILYHLSTIYVLDYWIHVSKIRDIIAEPM